MYRDFIVIHVINDRSLETNWYLESQMSGRTMVKNL